MKGITFLGDGKIELLDFPDPTPGIDEVVLEIKASGMCGSDLKQYLQDSSKSKSALHSTSKPIIAGHEPCGVVVAIGSNVSKKRAHIGMKSMVFHYDGCGVCSCCITGWNQLCTNQIPVVYGANTHGSHARYMKVAAHNLVPLPDNLSYEAGAAIACGTGTAWGALQRLGLQGDHSIAIFGQGPVGLSGTQLAVAMGAYVIAIDTNEERLTLARAFGAHATINPTSVDNVVDMIKELTHGQGVHHAIDASSSPVARVQAVQSVRTWGKVCYVGVGNSVKLDVAEDLIFRQVSVIGHWTFSKVGQAECARFIADRGINIDKLFTHRWRLNQGEEAYRLFNRQGTGKGVFLPSI